MNPENILLPIDIRRCPVDVFPLTDRLAARHGVHLTLLHVITLNILPPEARIYDELAADARAHLSRIWSEYLPSVTALDTRVRFGHVVDEVLAEIHASHTDLVIAPTQGSSFLQRVTAVWKNPSHPMMSRGVERILREAGCNVFIASSRVRFDCDGGSEWPNPRTATPVNGEPDSIAAWDSISMVLSQKFFRPNCL
jgi:nucleotide-binding universal stress UspA family protein